MVERLCLLATQPEITASTVQQELDSNPLVIRQVDNTVQQPNVKQQLAVPLLVGTLKEQVAMFEKQLIKQALSEHPSIRQAAKALGCDQSTLVRKIQKFQLTRHISYQE